MTLDDEPVDESKMESNSPVVANICDVKGSKRDFSSSSTSSSDNERTEVEDSDNDRGSIGVSHASSDRFDTAKLESHRDGKCNDSLRDEANESYDREAILQRLAALENFDMLNYVLKIAKSREEAISKDTDKDFPQSRVARMRKAMQGMPDSLLHLMTGVDRPGDCGRPSDQKPDWFDEKKLLRGQKFAQDHMFSVHFAEMLSLFVLYSFEDSLKPFIITGKSSIPFTAFKRSLSAGLRFRNWFRQDIWSKETTAAKDVRIVRALHAGVRRKLQTSTIEEVDAATIIPNAWCPAREILLKDFTEACEAPAIGQCPFNIERNNPDRPKGMNQTNMAFTQWGTVVLIMCYPKFFGIHDATDEDLEGYCHLWRCIGWQLGMEDEYNICRGTVDEFRHRSRDLFETWVKPNLRQITPEWEHMTRCQITGVSVIVPGISYEVALLYLTEIIGLRMPRLYASLSYKDWITYTLLKSFFKNGIKLPGIQSLLNFMVNFVLDRAASFTPKKLRVVRGELAKTPETHAFNSSSST